MGRMDVLTTVRVDAGTGPLPESWFTRGYGEGMGMEAGTWNWRWKWYWRIGSDLRSDGEIIILCYRYLVCDC
jgi:hypothetical protein